VHAHAVPAYVRQHQAAQRVAADGRQARMKARHAAALALVVWYLMRPPLPHLSTHAVHKDTAATLRGWKMVRSFPTQKECEAHRANPWELCVASDDPRLKAKW
jgi:hypothetical protein